MKVESEGRLIVPRMVKEGANTRGAGPDERHGKGVALTDLVKQESKVSSGLGRFGRSVGFEPGCEG
jgi:hypothetical protein